MITREEASEIINNQFCLVMKLRERLDIAQLDRRPHRLLKKKYKKAMDDYIYYKNMFFCILYGVDLENLLKNCRYLK